MIVKRSDICSSSYWLDAPGSPWPEVPDGKPRTINYDDMLKQWKAGKLTL